MTPSKLAFVKILRRLPLFTDLSEAELLLIAENVSRVHFDEGAIIFAEGDPCNELLIVEEGTVKIIKSSFSGRQQLLGIERKGSSLAEVAVFDGGRYPASAEAASPTILLRLSADTFRNICLQNPEMALKVFKVLGHRLRHLVGLVEELSFSTVRKRLIAHLVRLAETTGQNPARGVQFQLTENNEELAVRLGTVRELVSRNLGRLHGENLIQMSRRTVTIPDLTAIRDEMVRGE
ncbi:MAG: Crp/Fnr family transcriptional regulator [Candidatus Acidiferrum sp.]|jgi:CRP-like cAMP-binding protein